MVLNNTIRKSTRLANNSEMNIFESRHVKSMGEFLRCSLCRSREMSDVVVGFFSTRSSVIFLCITVAKFLQLPFIVECIEFLVMQIQGNDIKFEP